jgi:hypothetical protein
LRTDVPLIAPPETFGPADYPLLSQVAQVAGSKILDCSRFLNVPMNLCALATAGWKASAGSVPRLALVVQIDAWALVKMMAPAAIAAVAAQKTELRLFYKRQLTAGHVHNWVLEGKEPGHELAATLEDLDTVWQGSAVVTNVIDAVVSVIRSDTTPARAGYLATLASVALKFEGKQRAGELARESLEAGGDAGARSRAQTILTRL